MTYRHKQILVLRKDLGMRKGKCAAQASHGVQLALFRDVLNADRERCQVTLQLDPALFSWLFDEDYAKICVSVNSEAELLALQAQVAEAGIRHALVQDNGHTEFHGVKTYTGLIIGPDLPEVLDPITGRLPLL